MTLLPQQELSMKHRILASLGAVALFSPILAFAQSKASAPKRDLQGIWTNATVTPLERPQQFADKAFLTKEEAAAFEKLAVYDANGDRRDGTAEADVGRAYNEFWRDRGKVVLTMRSSLIVDP